MFLKKIKNILFTILLIISIIPINSFAYSDYIIASGQNIGINIKSKGIMVVGLYNVGDVSPSKDAGIQLGDYITKIDGYVVKTDYTTIKNLIKEINKIGVNINQIAKRTNETNRIYEDDIKELKGELEQVWQLLKSNLSSQH